MVLRRDSKRALEWVDAHPDYMAGLFQRFQGKSIPAHAHQSNYAIVFEVPRHQHGREKAEDEGEHQSKPNPNVLHRNLDTEGALSSQDRWPA
jgi:hypothetical protein